MTHSSNTVIGGSALVPFVFVKKRFLSAPLICTDKTDISTKIISIIGFIGENGGYGLIFSSIDYSK